MPELKSDEDGIKGGREREREKHNDADSCSR